MVSYSETAEKIGRHVLSVACHCQLFIQYTIPGPCVKAMDFSQMGRFAPCVHDLYLVLLCILLCNYYSNEPTPQPHKLIRILQLSAVIRMMQNCSISSAVSDHRVLVLGYFALYNFIVTEFKRNWIQSCTAVVQYRL